MRKPRLHRHAARESALQLQPDLGRNCAYQLDVARQAHVAAIDAESVLAGLDITHVEDDRILPAGFGQAAKLLGWPTHLQKHRLYHIRVDFHVRSQVLVFHVHRNEGRQLRFAGDRNPKQHGRRQRQKLPADVLCEEVLHFGSALSGRWFSMGMSAANSSIRCGALRRTPKCVQIRSSTSRRLRPVASSPKAATEMRPVSSETTSDRQSVSSVMPMAARWRVPKLDDTARSEEHTSELQSPCNLVCRLLLEKKKKENTSCHHNFLIHNERRRESHGSAP